MKGFVRFLSYHNAVPISLSIILLTSGAAFASSPEARDVILSSETKVISIDNTYLVQKDLGSYTPRAVITGVTEDAENYYVAYELTTIEVQDQVWQDLVERNTMTVDKALLGDTRDLGMYVTEQLGQIIDRKLSYLREVQAIERKQVSQKMVATVYSGLIGRLLDDHTEVLPGYVPVVVPPPPPPPPPSDSGSVVVPDPTVPPPAAVAPGGGPQIKILGNNPARITIRSAYIDLGVMAMDAAGQQIGVRLFVNDQEKSSVQIDTYAVGEWRIRYEATDSAGRTATAERIVEVYDPYAPVSPPAAPPAEAPTSTEPAAAASTEPPATSTQP